MASIGDWTDLAQIESQLYCAPDATESCVQLNRFKISGPVLILPVRHEDSRGFFMETFRDEWFRENIANLAFVQDNHSLSKDSGTIRGLHYQTAPSGQGKLVRCVQGAIFDVAVDIRPSSTTFGKWVSATLSATNGHQLWIPDGFAHGFCTLEADTEVLYKVTHPYSPAHDAGVAPDDPDIGITWPIDVANAILSDKDKNQPTLSALNLR